MITLTSLSPPAVASLQRGVGVGVGVRGGREWKSSEKMGLNMTATWVSSGSTD